MTNPQTKTVILTVKQLEMVADALDSYYIHSLCAGRLHPGSSERFKYEELKETITELLAD